MHSTRKARCYRLVNGNRAGIALMGRSWSILFSLLAIPFLPFVIFSLALCEFFLLGQCMLPILFFDAFAVSVEARRAMRLIVHCNVMRFDKAISNRGRFRLNDRQSESDLRWEI